MTTRTPAPVDVPTTVVTTGPLDRAPAPVSPATDPELPRTPVPVLRPAAVAPAPAPTPYRETATPTPVLPIEEAAVDLTPPAESEDRNIIPADTPRYVTVLEDGTVVVSEAAQLNFSGSGVSVIAQGSTANIVITGGSSSYGNANVAAYLPTYTGNLAALTGNVTTTANINGGNIRTAGNISANTFFGNGSQLTGIVASAGGITFEYAIGNFTANALPLPGTMQFTNRDGEVVAPDLGTRLWISANDSTGLITGSTWLAMAQNSERGIMTLQQGTSQIPFRVTDVGTYSNPETYRGYRAGVNQIWGDDPSINQIIITNAAAPVFYNENFDLEDDVFHATGLADATAVYMVNVYGSDDYTPLSQNELWSFFTRFVDNVIYQNTNTETFDVTAIRTAFYTNFSNFYNSISTSAYDQNFQFTSGTTYYPNAEVFGEVAGVDGRLRVRLNSDYTYTIMGISTAGTGYQVNNVLLVYGEDIGGLSPDNDITLTVSGVDDAGGITAVVINSGVSAYSWPTSSISDGGDDQYDTANRINTNLATRIIYAGGNVTPGTTTFGADSNYAVMYNTSVFCMAATGVDITDLYYSGGLGADGDGFLRWSGLRNSTSDGYDVQYAYMTCDLGTGDLEPQVGETYQVAVDNGGINLDQFYSYFNDANNEWYFGADRDWTLESRAQLAVQSYNTLILQTLIPNEAASTNSPNIDISTDTGSRGNAQFNQQAGAGGSISITAGSAGTNNSVPGLGNNGGAIAIIAGDATGNGRVGGGVLIEAGSGAFGTAGNVTLRTLQGATANGAIRLETNNTLNNSKLWTFDAAGTLTVPGVITALAGNTLTIQAVDNADIRSQLIMEGNGDITKLNRLTSQNSNSYFDDSWATATYVAAGGGGEIAFVDAPSIIDLVNGDATNIFLQVNGGALLPYDGFNSGGSNITFLVAVPPATDPTTVTSFEIYYQYESKLEIDYDDEVVLLQGVQADILLETRQTGSINIQSVDGALIQTDVGNSNHAWFFTNTGNLILPAGGNIVGTTANNIGHLQWIGNSSGDGLGYTTLNLIPDDTLTGADQYLIVDPTAPGHIHIRAGGTPDNSQADLILGGENSFVKIASGANSDVFVRSNGNQWEFGTDGVLTLPAGEGILQSTDDTINLVSFNTTTGNANSVYLGTSGGLGFNDQEIGGNWLEIFRNGAEPEIRVPVDRGNLNIQTAQGNTACNWTFDNTGNLTIPGTSGGLIKTVANASIGIAAMDNGTDNPAQLMSWNVNQANPSTIISTYANSATIMTDVNGTPKAWTFDNTGNLTLPADGYLRVTSGIIGTGASPAPSLSGFSTLSAVAANISGNITAGNISTGSGSITGGNVNGNVFNGNVAFGSGTIGGAGNITGGNLIASNRSITTPAVLANLTAVAGARAFASDANLVAVGNFGAQVSGGASNTVPVYSDGTNWYIG